jgi:phosphatidylglycerophosphate synthase
MTITKISDLKAFQKEKDSLFTTLFTRKISIVISFLLLKYFKKITPNQVTFISLLLTVLAVGLFFSKNYLWRIFGVVFLQLGFALDCSDGEIARYKNSSTKFGAWLDSIFDRFKEFLMFSALTYLAYLKNGHLKILIIGFLVVILWQLLAYIREAKRSFWPGILKPEFFITKNIYLGTVDGIIYLISLAIIFQIEEWILYLFLILSIPLLIKQIIGAFKFR